MPGYFSARLGQRFPPRSHPRRMPIQNLLPVAGRPARVPRWCIRPPRHVVSPRRIHALHSYNFQSPCDSLLRGGAPVAGQALTGFAVPCWASSVRYGRHSQLPSDGRAEYLIVVIMDRHKISIIRTRKWAWLLSSGCSDMHRFVRRFIRKFSAPASPHTCFKLQCNSQATVSLDQLSKRAS